jgi:hypothetical protein
MLVFEDETEEGCHSTGGGRYSGGKKLRMMEGGSDSIEIISAAAVTQPHQKQ